MLGLFRSEADEHTTRTPEMVAAERRTILNYTKTDGSELNWDYISRVWQSQSKLVLCPLQDVLSLGSESRMNIPGKSGEFWNWRFRWDQLTPQIEERLKQVTDVANRWA